MVSLLDRRGRLFPPKAQLPFYRSPLNQCAELMELKHLLEVPGGMENPGVALDNNFFGEATRLQFEYKAVWVRHLRTLPGNCKLPLLLSELPTKGQVELQGRSYCWTLVNESLQLVAVQAPSPASLQPSPSFGGKTTLGLLDWV